MLSPSRNFPHDQCSVICCEITLEKCICVGRTIVSTVPPSDKNLIISGKHECLGEVMVFTDPFFASMHS